MYKIPPSRLATSRGEEYEPQSPRIIEEHYLENEESNLESEEYDSEQNIHLGIPNEDKPFLEEDALALNPFFYNIP